MAAAARAVAAPRAAAAGAAGRRRPGWAARRAAVVVRGETGDGGDGVREEEADKDGAGATADMDLLKARLGQVEREEEGSVANLLDDDEAIGFGAFVVVAIVFFLVGRLAFWHSSGYADTW